MKSLSIGKRVTIAALAAVALAGPVTAAHAFQITQDEAYLVVYGNGKEYSQDIGSIATVLAGANIDLNPFLATIGGSTTLKYTLVGYSGTTGLFGDVSPLSSFTNVPAPPGDRQKVSTNTLVSGLQGWDNAITIGGAAAQTAPIFNQSDAWSFSTKIDIGGTGSLGGALPGTRPGFSSVDSVLNLIEKTGTSSASMVQVGTGLFDSASGHFVIGPVAPVPVPAAVVLFATGVIGLIGVARRRVFGQQ